MREIKSIFVKVEDAEVRKIHRRISVAYSKYFMTLTSAFESQKKFREIRAILQNNPNQESQKKISVR